MSNTLALLNEFKSNLHELKTPTDKDISVLAQFLVDAIRDGDKSEIDRIVETFDEIVKLTMRLLPTDTRRELYSESASVPNLNTSLLLNMLGEMNIAQIIAIRSGKKIASEEFKSTLIDPDNAAYVDALFSHGDLSNTDLASEAGKDVSTISRKVQELASIGVITRRSKGKFMVNSLSPAAKKIVSDSSSAQNGKRPMNSLVLARMTQLNDSVIDEHKNLLEAHF